MADEGTTLLRVSWPVRRAVARIQQEMQVERAGREDLTPTQRRALVTVDETVGALVEEHDRRLAEAAKP